MRYLLVLGFFFSTASFADGFDVLVEKARFSSKLDILESTPDHITYRQQNGLIQSLTRQQGNDFMANLQAQVVPTPPEKQAMEGIYIPNLPRSTMLKRWRYLAIAARFSCNTIGFVGGGLGAGLFEMGFPIVIGGVIYAASQECVAEQNDIIKEYDDELKVEKEKEKAALSSAAAGSGDPTNPGPPNWVLPGGPGIPCTIGADRITRMPTPPGTSGPVIEIHAPFRLTPCPGTQ